MSRQFVIRFDPFNGGNWVNAEAFARSLVAIVDGLHSMAGALAPAIAQRRAWSRQIVREALTLAVGPLSKGSLDVALMAGGAASGSPIDTEMIASLGLRSMMVAVSAAACGKTRIADVPVTAARHLATGARVARDSNVRVSVLSRNTRGNKSRGWRTMLDLTDLEPGLTSYVERRASAERSVTQIVGQIVSIFYDPPGFAIATGRGKLNVAMPAALRSKVREFWGEEVIVLAEAQVTVEGDTRDPKALEIAKASRVSDLDDTDDPSLAALREKWNTIEARDYFASLRGRT